ncbi:amino acid ABC transporter permease [Paraburkholderia aspalathi]|nr:amino acid ABC transporter permease [Paraburkholderia aspalathi]
MRVTLPLTNVSRLGAYRVTGLRFRHGAILLVLFCMSIAVAQAQMQAQMQAEAIPTAIETLIRWMPFILKGFLLNLAMSIIAMLFATILGIGLGLLQISQLAVVRRPASFVTHVLRNSPWLVILFMVMYLVPFQIRFPGLGLVAIPDWWKATFAFMLPVMANIAEILRGAVQSIPNGQWESAESLVFSRSQTLRYIILPQCIRRMIPSWMNWYALLALATPMASILGVNEAVGNAQAAMEAAGSRPEFLIPFYLFLMCLFFAFIYPIAILTRKLEAKYAVAS